MSTFELSLWMIDSDRCAQILPGCSVDIRWAILTIILGTPILKVSLRLVLMSNKLGQQKGCNIVYTIPVRDKNFKWNFLRKKIILLIRRRKCQTKGKANPPCWSRLMSQWPNRPSTTNKFHATARSKSIWKSVIFRRKRSTSFREPSLIRRWTRATSLSSTSGSGPGRWIASWRSKRMSISWLLRCLTNTTRNPLSTACSSLSFSQTSSSTSITEPYRLALHKYRPSSIPLTSDSAF